VNTPGFAAVTLPVVAAVLVVAPVLVTPVVEVTVLVALVVPVVLAVPVTALVAAGAVLVVPVVLVTALVAAGAVVAAALAEPPPAVELVGAGVFEAADWLAQPESARTPMTMRDTNVTRDRYRNRFDCLTYSIFLTPSTFYPSTSGLCTQYQSLIILSVGRHFIRKR
jgi:hypothetical protein